MLNRSAVNRLVNIHTINPLSDDRWDAFVRRHPRASAFHQTGWLRALNRTYGHQPIVLTTASSEDNLSDGIVLAQVSSWITGTRLVSLPFADHCEPLLDNSGQAGDFIHWLKSECDRRDWRYVELRPREQSQAYAWQSGNSFYLHCLHLGPGLEQIFQRLHKDSIQRKIRRAEKEKIFYEAGRSQGLLDEFYRLVVMTRKRQQLLPQPRKWFANLIEEMGEGCQIRVARKGETPIAAIFTLQHGTSLIYKYGCSNEEFHQLGGMPFLFWKLIEESKASGIHEIDFGRSDLDQPGLIAFKDKFGTSKKPLTYYRYTTKNVSEMINSSGAQNIRKIFSVLPNWALSMGGSIAYRHMG
jgi:CelD/BcsL family acetyltransferase involved in cellulose biosynthesis